MPGQSVIEQMREKRREDFTKQMRRKRNKTVFLIEINNKMLTNV